MPQETVAAAGFRLYVAFAQFSNHLLGAISGKYHASQREGLASMVVREQFEVLLVKGYSMDLMLYS